MIEKDLQNKVIKWIKQQGLYYEKRQAGGWNYKAGLPDLFIVKNGKHIEIELKSPKTKILENKAMQVYWENKFKELNIPYLKSNNYQEVIEFIKNI